MVTDPRVVRGMRAQLASWRSRVAGGASRVGWKIGFNSPATQKQLGLDGTVVGHLTQATVLAPGASHSLAGSHLVCAEPEVAIHLGRDVPAGADGEAARVALAAFGERLRAGDRIICGSLAPPIWVKPGDRVRVDLGPLGGVEIALTA